MLSEETSVAEFKEKLTSLSNLFKAIDKLTAKKPQINDLVEAKTGNRNSQIITQNGKNTFPYCKLIKPCPDKIIHTVYTTHAMHKRYRLCTFTDRCNQQTQNRNFAIIEEK